MTNRRKFFWWTGGIVGVAAAGGAGLLAGTSGSTMFRRWCEYTVTRMLPGHPIAAESFDLLTKTVAENPYFKNRKRRLAMALDLHAPSMLQYQADLKAEAMATRRWLVTEFLIGSAFFAQAGGAPAAPLKYSGPAFACGNPFAVFRES